MKYFVVFLMLFVFNSIYAQHYPRKQSREFSSRFEELEKIKLIEILDMDENTAIKFFARRNKMKNNVKSIMANGEKIFDKMEENLMEDVDGNVYSKLIDESLEIERMIYEERSNFINSISDILSYEKITKLILFEKKFKKDVRDLLIERGRKKFFDRNKRK